MEDRKTVAERLREKPDSRSLDCWLAKDMLEIGCDIICHDCFDRTTNALADMIEAEQTVDVAALLKLADDLEETNRRTGRVHLQPIEAADRIREILKGAAGSKSTPLPEGIEWPRFEDGELVMFGEEFVSWDGEAHKVRSVEIFSPEAGPDYAINPGAVHNFVGGKKDSHGEFVKRPEPEVLDADGVPIKVGDMVYSVESGREVKVVEIVADSPYSIRAEDARGLDWRYEPKKLTHRKPDKPDTQEAINHDAMLLVSESFFDQRRDEFEDRVFDLLRRQRKLLGGE